MKDMKHGTSKVVQVLGNDYTIYYGDATQYPVLTDLDGACDTSTRSIFIDSCSTASSSNEAKGNLQVHKQHITRHELIHAFLYESGLDACVPWVTEEMVDWLAIQSPKLFKLFQDTRCI